MYVVVYLEECNMNTITVELCEPKIFHGSEMHFLKLPIQYAFQEPIDIQRSSFGLKLVNIPRKDRDIINTMFWRMNRYLYLKDTAYINYPENKEQLLEKGDRQLLHVQIQGYKKSTNGNLTPIWKILHEKYY